MAAAGEAAAEAVVEDLNGATSRVLPLDPDAWPFVLGPLAAAAACWVLGWRRAAGLGLALAGGMVFFFRDPERHPPARPGAVLAPADGRVTEVRHGLVDTFVGPASQVSIFLSPLDVHVNRAPVTGEVVSVERRPGRFLPAYRAEASRENEQTTLAIQAEGFRVVVRQVAGVVARRVVCRVQPGDRLQAGQRFGIIRFGSRLDVVVPASLRLEVRPGDRVRAGESVLGVME